jgi:hypothetical protein
VSVNARAAIGAVLLACCSAGERVDAASSTCVPARPATAGYPVLLVKARVNGRGPYTFFVDTGATVSIVSTSLADELQLDELPVPVHGIGAGGRFTAHAAYATISVGDVRQDHVLVATFDFAQIIKAVGPIDGGLGYNFLRAYRVTIDFPRQRLCLAAP